VELLYVGAFGAAGEVECELGILGFHQEVLHGAEELGGLFGKASGQEEAKNARVVVAEINLLAVGKFDGEEMAEVGTEFFERHVAGDENAPAFRPGLVDKRIDKSRFLRDADEVGSEMG